MHTKTTAEEIEHLHQCARDLDLHPPPDPPEDFGTKLKTAVKRRVASRSRHKNTAAASSVADATFAEKLTRIAKEKAKQRSA